MTQREFSSSLLIDPGREVSGSVRAIGGRARARTREYLLRPHGSTTDSNQPRLLSEETDMSKLTPQQMREKVAAQFAEDGVTPDEVVLQDNGDIVIDRRATKPWAEPMKVGTWTPS